jgi:hypothetical protein
MQGDRSCDSTICRGPESGGSRKLVVDHIGRSPSSLQRKQNVKILAPV